MIGIFSEAGGLDEAQAAGDGKAQRRQNFAMHRHRPRQRVGTGDKPAHGDGAAHHPLALRQGIQDGEGAPRMPDEENGHPRKAGFGTDTNVATLVTSDGCEPLPMMSKRELADIILDRISVI